MKLVRRVFNSMRKRYKELDYINGMLEFDKIKEKLKEFTVTKKAKERLNELMPIMIEKELRDRMKETSEARTLLDVQGTPPLSKVNNIREYIESALRGESLSIDELENIKIFATGCNRIIRYLNKSEDLNLKISEYSKGMMNLEFIKDEIERCIRNGRVDDYASKELKEVRKKIEQLSNNMRIRLENMLKNKKEYFSESFVSNRNGHFTLPVKKEYKHQISGSVIDVSSSGATYFIEPSSVAKMKEELNELNLIENNEERRILYMLSSSVSDFSNDILLNLEYIEDLDYIFAKAKLSAHMDGKEPSINTNRYIRIVNGRHPLINRDQCIPLNIEFRKDIRGVIITGPNTGGKTVALKTVGLFSVMTQCGLHIPCYDGDICMNTQVLCDIGDGQSITENLSTFSSHIKNVIAIMKLVDKEALVLMDELGSGTDPTEGMGIGIAILEELKQSNCNFIATTHYPEVKDYAKHTENIMNARMAFDKQSLKPLYRLEMGEAGESCALYIAKRLGMSSRMLAKAYEVTYHKSNPEYSSNNNIISELSNQDDNSIDDNKIVNETNHKVVQIQKMDNKATTNLRFDKFRIGDSVMVYPSKKLGIVFQRSDSNGNVGVQIQKKKIYVNHKRLQLKAAAKDLYPENYDFSIIFDSVENRKAAHVMNKRYDPNLMIVHDTEDGSKK